MFIKQFSSSQFAGLKNIKLDFDQGLNVIVGDNETGKSTIINAIFSVLFVGSNLKKSRNDDKTFMVQYLPYPAGDYMDGEVILHVDSQEYGLAKKWGNQNSASLRKPDGIKITVEKDIEAVLNNIFTLGPTTYQNIVFARQSQLKAMLEKLREKETIHSVSFLLREAVMNLDGVSTDKLRADIEAQLDDLLKRWDYENNRPQENRIYKTGLGKVLSSYYEKERLRQEMNRAYAIEQELYQISGMLHECENKNKNLTTGLQKLEPLEEDIMKRAEIEPRINALKKHSGELKAVSLQWPRYENEYKNAQNILAQLTGQIELIKKEAEACRSQKEKEALAQIINKVEENRIGLADLNNAGQNLVNITDEDLKQLEALNQIINTARTAMKAGKMWAVVHSQPDLDIWVTRDLEGETRLNSNQIDADGYLKIRLGELAEIELKSGELDFKKVRQDYTAAQNDLTERLQNLGVTDLEAARQAKIKLDDINRKIAATRHLIASLLGGQDYDELKARLLSLSTLESARLLPVIQNEQKNLEKQIIDTKANLITLNHTLQEWTQKYRSQAELLDAIIGGEVEIRGLEAELNQLQPLPEGVANAGQFRQHIKQLKDELKQGEADLREHWRNHDAREKELPEESCEDLKVQYESAEREFKQNLFRADKLMRIKKVFDDTMAEMDSNSLQPLVDSFSRYLAPATRGRYKTGMFDTDFEVKLIRQDEVSIPVNLLSSGTYDSVALSLRFAMLDHIFSAGAGFVVLDDCLVDLDTDRRQEAISIIRNYADRNQVIFTTCSNDTALLLGGNIIKLQSGA